MNITATNQTLPTQETESKTFSQPRILLLIEGLTLFVATVMLYAHFSGDWVLFVVLLLAPDLAFFAYAINNKIGSTAYNLAHLTTVPAILLAIGLASQTHLVVTIALIWFAHIWMDRAVGYGFKYATNPKDTHMGRI